MANSDKKTGAGKILIVDDVEINRMVLEEIIDNMGYSSVLAESGEQALEMIKEQLPLLVLTDISMPGITGYELCRMLKENEETKKIPVIFISAFDNPQDIVEGFILGGEDYITKPFVSEIVQARVGVHLRLYEAQQDLMEINRRLQSSINEQLKQMEQEKKNTLYALANMAEQNADYEEEHMERLKQNCRILAQGMQLSPLYEDKISDTDVDTIELAASLCDIGNIGIPREILLKKDALTDDEISTVHSHTKLGAKLLSDIYVSSDYNDFISTSIEVVQHHHENWDGTGYPDGLSGDEIPLAAQIVSVVDRYCELTGRGNDSREEALSVMDGEAGIKFNPNIFSVFRKISRQLC